MVTMLSSLPHLSLTPRSGAPATPPATAYNNAPADLINDSAVLSNNKTPASSFGLGLGAMAKRSVSATGLSRRSSSDQPMRSRSVAPVLKTEAEVVPSGSARNLRSLLASRTSTPANTPPQTAPPTPSIASTPIGPPIPAASQLEASYVSKVSLRLGEAVNRIFPAALPVDYHQAVVWKGRCSPRSDRAKDLGDIIVSETQLSAHDVYLLRTLIRSAVVRTLTIFLSRIEALVLTPATESSAALYFVPRTSADLSPTVQPAPQRFNFEIVRAAYEMRDALNQICTSTTPAMPSFVQDALLPWVSKFDGMIGRIMTPFVAEIKKSIAVTVSAARDAVQRTSSGHALATQPATATIGPLYMKELSGQLEAAKRLFDDVLRCGKESDKWTVSVATHITWKGMLAFAARPCPVPDQAALSRPASVPHKKSSLIPSTSRSKLSLRNGRRSPSPPLRSPTTAAPLTPEEIAANKLIDEVAAFRQLISQFANRVLPVEAGESAAARNEQLKNAQSIEELCEAFALLPELPPAVEGEEEDLAEEAMHEAMLALSSFELVLRALKWPEELKTAFIWDDAEDSSSDDDDESLPRMTPSAIFGLTGPHSPATHVAAQRATPTKAIVKAALLKEPCADLDRALDTQPPLITFHLLASRLPAGRCHSFRLPHEVWGLTGGWQEYEAQLKGFAMGEEWHEEVGWQMTAELDRLKKEAAIPEGDWETLLRLAVIAET